MTCVTVAWQLVDRHRHLISEVLMRVSERLRRPAEKPFLACEAIDYLVPVEDYGPSIRPTDGFDTIGSLFEGEYGLVTVGRNTPAGDALRMMLEKDFSQVPVIDENERLIGLFSLRSIALHIHNHPTVPVDGLPVHELLEAPETVTVDDSLHQAVARLYDHEALIVDSPQGIQAVVTAWDLLDYTTKISRPYMMIREVELALRRIINGCIPEADFQRSAKNALHHLHTDSSLPASPEELTFDEYRLLITNKKNWIHFTEVLGASRTFVGSKLENAGATRNTIMHFRATELSHIDLGNLEANRDWLLRALTMLPTESNTDD